MAVTFDEDFWDNLLDKIEEGKVIPVVGQAAITAGPANQPFYPWLAHRLAEKQGLAAVTFPPNVSLSQVVGKIISDGGSRNTLCSRIARIIRTESPAPGETLRALAKVAHFKLFLTTSIDSQLETALNEVRYAGAKRTLSLGFFPGSPADLPQPLPDLPSATVYHLHGRASTTPGEYVTWEDDLLDFICELQRHIGTDPMRRLSVELKSRSLLVLGLSLADWPVRFLLRVASQDSLSRQTLSALLAEGPSGPDTQSMVLFFSGVNENIKVIECEPREFADELARRWLGRHPVSAQGMLAAQVATPPESKMQPGSIFISYAREDEDAVKRLKTGLEHYGCDVWYDRERLGAGTDFHIELKTEITESCAIFVSLISHTTENPVGHNYFTVERNWAKEVAQGLTDIQRPQFYIPVLIEEQLPAKLVHEPEIFARHQWNHLPRGNITEEFGERLADIQIRYRAAKALEATKATGLLPHPTE